MWGHSTVVGSCMKTHPTEYLWTASSLIEGVEVSRDDGGRGSSLLHYDSSLRLIGLGLLLNLNPATSGCQGCANEPLLHARRGVKRGKVSGILGVEQDTCLAEFKKKEYRPNLLGNKYAFPLAL